MDQQRDKLPEIIIEGNTFVVDVALAELREKANPGNVILFSDMQYANDHYRFEFDRRSKNIAELFERYFNKEYVVSVEISQRVKLDPVGMAEKYGKNITDISGTTDFRLMVDQDMLSKRLNGILPILDIAGHQFYVDLRMGALRQKDDLTTRGIEFEALDDYLVGNGGKVWVSFDSKAGLLSEPDYNRITSVPEDLIVVEIPPQMQLDPVGFARLHGMDVRSVAINNPVREIVQATIIPWKETGINEIIERNIKRESELDKPIQPKQGAARYKKKGRGI